VALTAPSSFGKKLILEITDPAGRVILADRDFQGEATYSCSSWPAGIFQAVLSDHTGRRLAAQQLMKQ
jgi:hypothetical protein